MSQRCLECGTQCHDELGRCGACGALLLGAHAKRQWEQRVISYIVIALLGGLVAAVVWYIFYAPSQ
jgi:hypothetical protein